MKLVGDEKRIQALFRELRLEDQQVVPGFERVWNCARVAERRPAPRASLVALAAALIVVCTFLFWPSVRSSEIPQQEVAGLMPVTMPISVNRLETSSHRKLPLRKKAKPITGDAVALSTWKSPTAIFMESPSRSEINSLPQLNQAAKELQLFLPNDR